MIKPIAFFLGYTRFTMENHYAQNLLNEANRLHLHLHISSDKNDLFSFYAVAKDAGTVIRVLSRQNVEFSAERGGLPQFLQLHRHRVGVLIGILLYIALAQISTQFVWHISIVGNRTCSGAEVMEMLAQNGLYVGAAQKNVDTAAICAKIQVDSPMISWMTIHHVGTYYTVEIVERESGARKPGTFPYYNIVAARDGQIESLNIRSGRAVALPGTTVHKGDLLVGGVITTRTEHTKFANADAAVFARVEDEFYIEIPREKAEKIYGHPKDILTEVKFFGKNIFILKKTFKTDEKYDTIYSEKNIENAWLSALPVTICKTSVVPYREQVVLQEEEALLTMAREAAKRYIAERQYTEILGSYETYAFSEQGIRYTQNIRAVENIAAVSEFGLVLAAERE